MKFFILTLFLLLSFSLFARDAASKKNHGCKNDQKKYCSGIKKGKAQLDKCLKKHKKSLSKSCKEQIAGKKEKKKTKQNKKLIKKKKNSAYYKKTSVENIKEAKQDISPDAVQVVIPDPAVTEPTKL